MLTGLRNARLISNGLARDGILRSLHHVRPQGPSAASRVRQASTQTTASSKFFTGRVAPVQPLWRSLLFRRSRGMRHNSTNPSPNPTPHLGSPKPQGLSARLKELSKKYGWTAAGVYLGLSVLDFPFCFLAVQMLGPERVAKAEHWVLDHFWGLVGTIAPSMKPEEQDASDAAVLEHKSATIWTQLLLAYGVHKSLIFFRVPLAAAVTPKVAKFLRARGWNIGNVKPKSVSS
ncbi:Hypothetical protein R9X50_00134300 [Acrodontium crateriforme]|uniref:DUF1279 domain-containing protein n=1 Tax=Acrodontium crateriforme TaxID=150365 RepID=A0AAQ3M068_9PEZI|nr:Hypothetical protein R9X50_00134300 [Acrodontium crateriforme]